MTLLTECPSCGHDLTRDDQYRCPDPECGHDLVREEKTTSARDTR